jgi:hypothetical protein
MSDAYQIVRVTAEDRMQQAAEINQIRETYRISLELLRRPFPDTFLGRKTQEPFPKQDRRNLGRAV